MLVVESSSSANLMNYEAPLISLGGRHQLVSTARTVEIVQRISGSSLGRPDVPRCPLAYVGVVRVDGVSLSCNVAPGAVGVRSR